MNVENMSEAQLEEYIRSTTGNDPEQMYQQELNSQVGRSPAVEPTIDTMNEIQLQKNLKDQGFVFEGNDIIKNEQYAPIQGKERALIKNFSGDKQGTMNYLHKNHPESEFKYSRDGEVLGRDRGTNYWKKLDVPMELTSPSTWELQDISDVGTDILSGGAEVAAGIAGAPMGVPHLAAAATSGALNSASQGIATAIGTREEFSPTEAVASSVLSGIGSKLFGVGGTKKLAAKFAGSDRITERALKKAAKEVGRKQMVSSSLESSLSVPLKMSKTEALNETERLTKKYVAEDVEQTMKGWFPTVGATKIKNSARSLASKLNGVLEPTMKYYAKHKEVIGKLDEKKAAQISRGYLDLVMKKIKESHKSLSNLYDGYKVLPQEFNVNTFKEGPDKIMKGLPEGLQFDDDVKNGVKNWYDKVFKAGEGFKSKTVYNVDDVIKLNKRLRSGQDSRALRDVLEKKGYSAAETEHYIRTMAGDARDKITNVMDGVTGGKWSKTNQQYKIISDSRRAFDKFKKKDGTLSFSAFQDLMENQETKAVKKRETLENIVNAEKVLGFGDTGKKAREVLLGYGTFGKGKAGLLSKNVGGMSVARSAGAAALGTGLGFASGGGAGSAIIGAGLGALLSGPRGSQVMGEGIKSVARGIGKASNKAALKNTVMGNTLFQTGLDKTGSWLGKTYDERYKKPSR